MDPSPYKTDFERQKQLLFDKYMRLRQSDRYGNSNERYQWVESAAKNQYPADVKVNNWVEEQWDVDYLKHKRTLLSDYDYAYQSEYLARYGDDTSENIMAAQRQTRCFPGHQPELDLPALKKVYDSFETTSRVAYQNPGVVSSRKKDASCIYCRLQRGHVRK